MNLLSRGFLWISALILLLGVYLHTSAFPKVAAAVTGSDLPGFFGQSLKALWLIDSFTLLIAACAFALLASKPALASGAIVALLGLIPVGTAVFLYLFMGRFPPAHLLLLAGGLAVGGGLLRIKAQPGDDARGEHSTRAR